MQQPLERILVVDLTRYLPGAFASRELLRLGARVVRVEAPDGDPMRARAPAGIAALRAGKESVVCDLKRDAAFARALARERTSCSRASDPAWPTASASGRTTCRERVVYCSITGFGPLGRHAAASATT